jgi:hypothetical protein
MYIVIGFLFQVAYCVIRVRFILETLFRELHNGLVRATTAGIGKTVDLNS